MRVVFRPSVRADFERLIGTPPLPRVRAFSAWAGDELIGIGGIVHKPDGLWASCVISDAGRRYPSAIWRGGLHLLALARRTGVRRLLAEGEASRAGSEALLERLGFRRIEDTPVFVWDARDQ